MFLSLSSRRQSVVPFGSSVALMIKSGHLSEPPDTAPRSRFALHEVLAAVAGRSAGDLIRESTPFLYQSLSRVYPHLLGEPRSNGAQSCAAAAVLAFDGLFELLPDRLELDISDWPWSDVVLPRQNALFRAPGGEFRLAKREASLSLRHAGRAGELAPIHGIREDIDSRSEVFALSCGGGALFGPSALRSIDSSAAPELARCVARALELIEDVDGDLASAIREFIKWYAPLHTISPEVHQSFTERSLPGVIFLSPHADPVVLSEAIVHEYGHNCLNQFDAVFPLTAGPDPGLYYSPWRSDPRPLMGLIHALYVFTDVLTYLAALERLPGIDAQRIRWRRELTFSRVELGMKQVPLHLLTDAGRGVFDAIREVHQQHAGTLDARNPEVARLVEQHRSQWRPAPLDPHHA